ncbi:iron chelate uptake ABC transporter family permease subunit [Actinomadura rugatobispora]|uniref:Iron chelate uptake ABC transporter family permease subunit n=1 Tax=Actinomadura rugatobispora TaxID=1994 RepID=A0ABW0ZWL1_9ACTN
MVPHTTRFPVGGDHRRVLPVAMLLGAVFLVAVDIATRTVDRPNEPPVSIFTTALGMPCCCCGVLRRGARDAAGHRGPHRRDRLQARGRRTPPVHRAHRPQRQR